MRGLGGLGGGAVAHKCRARVVARVAVEREVHGRLVVVDLLVLIERAVVAVGVGDVGLAKHGDDVAGDPIHREDISAAGEGHVGGVAQAGLNALGLAVHHVVADIVVLLEACGGTGVELVVLSA